MIEYNKVYEFENEFGKFSAEFETQEHPNNYGNGMLLVMNVTCDNPIYNARHLFDIRYVSWITTVDDIDKVARFEIEERYGVSL